MFQDPRESSLYIDSNGYLAEEVVLNGVPAVVHYMDIPESDITTIDGVRCTTALRTVIDIATQYTPAQLNFAVRDCLERNLFTPQEAVERAGRPDMQTHPGAPLLLRVLDDLST